MSKASFCTVIVSILAFLLALLLFFFLFFSITEYRPEAIEELKPLAEASQSSELPASLNLLSWNIGYCGLNSDTDFFLEGGEQRRSPELPRQEASLSHILSFLQDRSPDVAFLQEVDRRSSRSHKIDQAQQITEELDDYHSYFALNYNCLFVPAPLSAPLAKMRSGVQLLSRYPVELAQRHRLPGSYNWPVRLFHLKRCALISRVPSAIQGRDWVLINLHLSAYGNGSQRRQQLDYLKEYMLKQYQQGHFVIAGGDWNSLFPGVSKKQFGSYETDEEHLFWLQSIPEGWTPENWQWCYDRSVPTSRSLDRPYMKGENFTAVIDGFLISPNLEMDSVQGWDLGFLESDHNPVSIRVSIKQ